MPAQKRSREASPPPTTEEEEEKDDDLHPENQNQNDEEADEGDDSDESSSSSDAEKDEFITLRLSEIRKEVQCPICLGIIRKTRTVMECLHRFCRECIDKSMRMGNNECPACRTHCASRRSLRDDPNYDALIAILYPDIDKYEEEELAFHEEEMVRNKQQIQASIAQTLRRQTEALGRKRTSRATPPAFIRRSGNRNLRRRRNQRIEPQGSDDDEDANGHDDKDSSSGDDHSAEVKPKRPKRLGGRFSQGSTAGSANAGCDENDSEMNRESLGATALIGSSEILAWGKGGMRSQKTQNRYSSLGGRNGRLCRSSRVSKLIESLQHSNENDAKVDIGLMLVSLCEEDIPSLQRPYLCCRPTLTVKHLIQYVSLQTSIQADEIDMLVMKEPPPTDKPSSSEAVPITKSVAGVPCNSEFDKLQEHQTLEEIQPSCGFSQCNLLLAYRRKPKE